MGPFLSSSSSVLEGASAWTACAVRWGRPSACTGTLRLHSAREIGAVSWYWAARSQTLRKHLTGLLCGGGGGRGRRSPAAVRNSTISPVNHLSCDKQQLGCSMQC